MFVGFHHVLLKYGHENAKLQKRKLDDVKLRYSINFTTPPFDVNRVAIWITILYNQRMRKKCGAENYAAALATVMLRDEN